MMLTDKDQIVRKLKMPENNLFTKKLWLKTGWLLHINCNSANTG